MKKRMRNAISGASALGAALLLAAPSASAVTFDFAQWAIDNGEQGFSNGAPFTWTLSGLTVTATAGPVGAGPFVYLDGLDSGRRAGMGVCGSLTTTLQCSPSNDDNVTAGDTLRLTFSAPVTLDAIAFRDANHRTAAMSGTLFGAGDLIDVQVDGLGFSSPSLATGSFPPPTLFGTTFDFRYNNEEFYIETLDASPVPEPSTMVLLGAGILGLVGRVRRRRH
jgi:hypothetical protein